MEKSVFACLCALAGSLAWADVYTWTNDVATSAKWTNQANWNVSGAIPELPPTNGAHVVQFGPLAHYGRQEIGVDIPGTVAQPGGSTYYFALESITDTAPVSRRTLVVRNDHRSLKEVAFDVNVGSLAGFDGYWRSLYGRVLFNLADGDTLSNIAADRRARVKVPASASATLDTLYTEGTLDKQGAGKLTVNATQGADTRLAVSDGTLTLTGRPTTLDAGDDLPVPGAWLHLDASRPETFKTTLGTDGRTYVTNWCDVRGNGVYAWFDSTWKRATSQTYLSDYSSAPFLNEAFVPGHTVVDFGRASSNQDAALGPIGCWLKLSAIQAKVREVFYAGSYKSNGYATIIPGIDIDGTYHFHRGGNSLLFNATHASPCVLNGDILVNNVPQSNTWVPTSTFHVFSVGATNNVKVGALATDRMYASRVGNAYVGEFIVFTNALTHAQRVQVQTHLMRKWGVAVQAAEAQDASSIVLSKATSALEVPADRTVVVGEVTAAGGTLVKKGAGHLDVGVLAAAATGSAELPSLDVQAGDVTITGLAQPTTVLEPASNPWLWLDAAATDSFGFTNKTDDTTEYVARWNDRRSDQTTIWAELPVSQSDYAADNFPARIPNVVGTLPVVDFGPYGLKAAGASYLKLNSAGYQKNEVYEAFIVLKLKDAYSLPVFGSSSSIRFYRASTSRLLQGDYGYYDTQNALWTVDGAPVDPLATDQGKFAKNQFYVVSVALAEKVYIDLVGCKDRVAQGTGFGGAQVAEQVLYSRRLTTAERHQTIAYLMQRWQNRLPAFASEQKLADVHYGADVSATFDSGVNVSVGSISGGDGAFVKKGAGALEVAAWDATSFNALSVQEGSAALTLDFIHDAAFHFDASDVDSLTYYVTDDGARTNVTSVADVRRNGTRANAWINAPYVQTTVNKDVTPWVTNYVERAVTYTNPVWRVVQAAPGVYRPTFDFGRESGYYQAKFDSSSAFLMNVNFRNTVAGKGIKEAYAVFANNAAGDAGNVFGHDIDYHFMTGGSVLFSTAYAAEFVKNGYIALDGAEVASNAKYPAADTGLHVLAVKPNSPASINGFGLERYINAGGCYVSEFIGFTNELTDVQRTCLQQYLRAKWTETVAAPAFPKAFTSIEVATGTTLTLKGGYAVSAAKISGAGRLVGASVQDLAEIDVACAGGDTLAATIDADVMLASAVEIVFTGDAASLTAGEHVLLRTGGLTIDGVDWTFTDLNLRKWEPSISVADGNLVLRLVHKGTTFLLR